VRSSGTTEDAGDSSFAGMNASFTNVIGLPDVLARVKDCWASLYGERVLAYRAEQQLTEEPAIAVIHPEDDLLRSVEGDVHGRSHYRSPRPDDHRVGVRPGRAIVSGRVEPDTYILDEAGPRLLSVRNGKQTFKIVRGPDGADVEQPLDAGEVDRRSLSQAEIVAIAELGFARRAAHPSRLGMGAGGGRNVSGPVASDHHSEGSGGIRAATDGFGYPDSLTLWLGGICRARVSGGYGRRLAAQRGAMA
jgi:phosphoenolpyruvate synthase/pyruvate phosphate dikinase